MTTIPEGSVYPTLITHVSVSCVHIGGANTSSTAPNRYITGQGVDWGEGGGGHYFFFFFFYFITEHTQVTPGLPMLQMKLYNIYTYCQLR